MNNPKIPIYQYALYGAQYLINQIDPKTGKFIYRRASDGKIINGQYNILRHYGAIWACAYAINTIPMNSDLMALYDSKLKKTLEYPTKAQDDTLIIAKKPGVYKLGAQALGILAYRKMGGWNEASKLLQGMETFLSPTQAIKFYKMDNPTTPSSFKSNYYGGEAALAYCEMGEPLKAINILNYLITRKYMTEGLTPDHWAMQAIEMLLHRPPSNMGPVIYAWGEMIGDCIFQTLPGCEDNITRLACRLEGIVSYYAIAKPEKRALIEIYIERYMESLFEAQDLSDSKTFGAFFDKGFSQIDTTQHALMAILRFHQLKKKFQHEPALY